MKRAFLLLSLVATITASTFGQTGKSLLIGDFNTTGDFISLRAAKTIEINPLSDSPKFAKIKLGQKELVLTYKVTGEGKGAVRYFEPLKNEWVDVFTLDCCARAAKTVFLIYDGKGFKQKNNVLMFYTEVYSDTAKTQVEKKQLQIAKFTVGNAFRKYVMNLNPKNKFPHKLIVSRWIMREQLGENEDKYKEYSLEEKVQTGF